MRIVHNCACHHVHASGVTDVVEKWACLARERRHNTSFLCAPVASLRAVPDDLRGVFRTVPHVGGGARPGRRPISGRVSAPVRCSTCGIAVMGGGCRPRSRIQHLRWFRADARRSRREPRAGEWSSPSHSSCPWGGDSIEEGRGDQLLTRSRGESVALALRSERAGEIVLPSDAECVLVAIESDLEAAAQACLDPWRAHKRFSVTDPRSNPAAPHGLLVIPWGWRRTVLNAGTRELTSVGALIARARVRALGGLRGRRSRKR